MVQSPLRPRIYLEALCPHIVLVWSSCDIPSSNLLNLARSLPLLELVQKRPRNAVEGVHEFVQSAQHYQNLARDETDDFMSEGIMVVQVLDPDLLLTHRLVRLPCSV